MRIKSLVATRLKGKIWSTIILLGLCVECFTSNGQNSSIDMSLFNREWKNFLQHVQLVPADTAVSYPVIRNFELKLNNIVIVIEQNQSLNAIEKDKARRSVAYFLQEVNKNLAKNNLHLYGLDDAVVLYQKVLTTILQQKPLVPVLMPVDLHNSQLIAASVTQFKEYTVLNDVTTYKRVSSAPEFILQFLETNPEFPFADSLLLEAVLYDPMNIIYYLRKGNAALQQRIRNLNNNYIRQIVYSSNDKYATDLSLFAAQIANGLISQEDIISARAEPTGYFQLLVNTLLDPKNSMGSGFLLPLKNGIRERALAFYVNEINSLHNATDAVRFASVNGLRLQDLYFIITTCGNELYTSSYLGLYKRLVAKFNDKTADALFETLQWENFHVFIRMAANYNVLEDFLHRLSPEKMLEVLRLFINNIEEDPTTALENAMDIADSYNALCTVPKTCELIEATILENLERCVAKQHYFGIRLYGILNDLLKLVRQKEGLQQLWNVLGDYEILKHSSLENARAEITELVLFYGDEDGISSFSNFLKGYTDRSIWEVSRNKYWVSIKSLTDHPLTIYASLPLDMQQQADLTAQDSLFAYLEANDLQPAILVHRGHSYHLDKTLKRLAPSVKLAIVGSCGSYNKAISIASINPEVQVIGSKKMGSKSINDPILDMINELLSKDEDLLWPAIWNKLENQFRKDAATLTMFHEYFAPAHNLGLFVLKLYKANNRLL